MGKTFTYSYPTRICYSEQIDEFCEDMDSFDYEVSDEEIRHALAVMMYESEFEKSSILEDKEIKKTIIKCLENVIDNFDIQDKLEESWKDDLKDFFEKEAFQSIN